MRKYDSYKDSGVEWIGEIPFSWEFNHLGQFIDFISGYAFKSEEYNWDEAVKLVRGINVKEGHFKWANLTRYWSQIDSSLERFLSKEDDVLVAIKLIEVPNYLYFRNHFNVCSLKNFK